MNSNQISIGKSNAIKLAATEWYENKSFETVAKCQFIIAVCLLTNFNIL